MIGQVAEIPKVLHKTIYCCGECPFYGYVHLPGFHSIGSFIGCRERNMFVTDSQAPPKKCRLPNLEDNSG